MSGPGDNVKNGDNWEDGWSLRARLVIRPGLEDGGLTVTAEGSRGTVTTANIPGTFPTATVTSPLTGTATTPSCSVTLNAGPHHTLTLTCTPGTAVQKPPPSPPPCREVASQTSHSLIPHLFQQFQSDSINQGVPLQPDLKKANQTLKKCGGVKTGVRTGTAEKGKNPRTVHIDVYCTESSDSCSSEESVSSPQTVYESGKSRVVHERKGSSEVPRAMTVSKEETLWDSAKSDALKHGLRREKRRELSTSEVGTTGGTCGSSGYPSVVSSAAWSGLASENSIWSVESSAPSLAQTDSFDYENSRDKLRILEKAKEWEAKNNSNWVSSDEESSEESSGSELAWSFAEADGGGLRRNETIKRSSPPTSLSDSDLIKPQPSILPNTFGPIIRRANRHIGPTKNPNCPCDTCRFHFSTSTTTS